jgi:hypothetical protein
MKTQLTEEQRQAILDGGGPPLEVTDSTTNQVFYLISAEQYRKARCLLEGVEEIDPSLYEIEDVDLTKTP